MSALLNGIHDRSTVVQKAFAFALGHLVRVSTTSVKQSYDINHIIVVVLSKHCFCFPLDIKRQQCRETTTEAQQLVLGERR